MPNRSLQRAGTEQAPVALLLPPVQPVDRGSTVLPDWHGLAPVTVAYLIRRYTRPGEIVLSPEAHPAITHAVRYLDRAAAVLTRHDDTATAQPESRAAGAALILAVVRTTAPPPALAADLATWRTLLLPGGFLVLALPLPGVSGGTSHRTATITAARAAGLFYHQHIPALLAPLPDDDPRTGTAPGDPPTRLWGARHVPVHRDLVAFTTTATSGEAAGA
jgi:hypothetical protein